MWPHKGERHDPERGHSGEAGGDRPGDRDLWRRAAPACVIRKTDAFHERWSASVFLPAKAGDPAEKGGEEITQAIDGMSNSQIKNTVFCKF